jgi:uncharacterized protein (TIGR03086 family)
MSANLRLYTAAVFAFEHVLKSAKPTAFNRKAPCEGWTGKDVYEHGAGNLAMIKSFTSTGKGPKTMPTLGADPIGAWVKLREQTLAVLDAPGALDGIAHDPFGPGFGPMPVDVLVGFMAADIVPHTWDLARTAKVDERLDAALVKHTMATWKGLPADVLRSPGMMAAAIKSAPGADAQTKMLNFLGRVV